MGRPTGEPQGEHRASHGDAPHNGITDLAKARGAATLELHWWGTTEQGEPFDLRAITHFTVREGLVVSRRLFAEVVEQGGADINDAVEAESGHRPQLEERSGSTKPDS